MNETADLTADTVLGILDKSRVDAPTERGRVTRSKLMAAAEVCFAQTGFDGTTVAGITARAGVSHGNFYRHFTGKDAILIAVVADLYGDLRQASGGGGAVTKPTLDGLVQRNTAFFRNYAERRHLFRVTREAAARPEADLFRTMWLSVRGLFIERSNRWILQCQTQGHVGAALDAGATAAALGAMTEQMAYLELGLPKAEPTDALIEQLGYTSGLIWFNTLAGGDGRQA